MILVLVKIWEAMKRSLMVRGWSDLIYDFLTIKSFWLSGSQDPGVEELGTVGNLLDTSSVMHGWLALVGDAGKLIHSGSIHRTVTVSTCTGRS